MVNGGMSTASALKTATLNPAIFMGRENEYGRVKEGYIASLVLLDANPLEDINNTRTINTVFLEGRKLDRAALDALLEEAKEVAANLEGSDEI